LKCSSYNIFKKVSSCRFDLDNDLKPLRRLLEIYLKNKLNFCSEITLLGGNKIKCARKNKCNARDALANLSQAMVWMTPSQLFLKLSWGNEKPASSD
jgi:hypothetical protein